MKENIEKTLSESDSNSTGNSAQHRHVVAYGIKSFCKAKNVSLKGQPAERGNIFPDVCQKEANLESI